MAVVQHSCGCFRLLLIAHGPWGWSTAAQVLHFRGLTVLRRSCSTIDYSSLDIVHVSKARDVRAMIPSHRILTLSVRLSHLCEARCWTEEKEQYLWCLSSTRFLRETVFTGEEELGSWVVGCVNAASSVDYRLAVGLRECWEYCWLLKILLISDAGKDAMSMYSNDTYFLWE